MQNSQLGAQFVEFVDEQGKVVALPLHRFLQKKREAARKQDQALGIQRAEIPALFIQLPDVPESVNFQKLANAIRGVAVCEHLAPETPAQGAWLRCVQLYWEAKAIVFANKIYNLIPDPVRLGEPVQKMLPAKALENLKLDVEAELAWYNLLRFFEPQIKIWAENEKIDYPFNDFEQLFIETLHIGFEIALVDEAFASFLLNSSRRQERNHYRDWLQFLKDGFSNRPSKQKRFVEILRSMEWKGYSLLALQDVLYEDQSNLKGGKHYKLLEKLWQTYLKKLRLLLKFLDSRLYWKDAVPYQSKQIDNGRRIKSREPIQAIVTDDGYFDWRWLKDN